jgi:peptide/nickel transport system ATP-binding protein
MAEALLDIRNLKIHYGGRAGLVGRAKATVRAVDGVSLALAPGDTLGLVGESGCGKSTLGRTLAGVRRPTAGELLYRTRAGEVVDLAAMKQARRARYFGEVRMVFQDPQSSLNPRLRVVDLVGEPLRNFGLVRRSAIKDRVAELLERVGLRPEYLERYPHAFSGGERQRIGIARAIATDPRLLIADEAVSALDVSIRAQVINLLIDLRASLGLTYVFISHDLSVVRFIANRVAVMYVGRIVEVGTSRQIFSRPRHPYTEALLSAVPSADWAARGGAAPIRLKGDVANPAAPPPGCHFHPRCRFATERCRSEAPALRTLADGQAAACHYAEELSLKGMGAPPAESGGAP